jgi:Domain of unknown function (DUF4129)
LNRRPAIASLAVAAWLALSSTGAAAQSSDTAAPQPTSKPNQASLDDYRNHLRALSALVQVCAKARNSDACDPSQVVSDDEVPLPQTHAQMQTQTSERRLVRYGWLRVLLSQAREKDAPPPKVKPAQSQESPTFQNVRPIPPTTSELLQSALTRLASDLAQTEAAAAPLPDHAKESAVMKQVLAGHEYSDLEAPNQKDTTLEKVGNWLNDLIESARKASARAPWLGRALVWGFILAVCVALVWGLIQMERRWRIRLVPDDRGHAPGAASAIPYQLWLEDARRAAAAGLWREAIHFLYWAAISRLESKRLWPADRARTPREYLALVAADDPRLPGLASLTGSFERVWYGGRPAAESDYQRAEQIASGLIHGGAAGLDTGAEAARASAGGAAQ